ncbi:histidinol-phosphate transaminase [soil metagenome]
MSSILSLVRPEIVAMTAYSSARNEQNVGEVWLNANESPWAHRHNLNRYPAPQPQSLQKLLSNIYQINSENMLITRGSDEAIDILLRTFCTAGKDAIMTTPPTYGMYQIAATIQGAEVIIVPLLKEQNFSLDVVEIVKQWRPAVKLIFFCSPNNPTGNLLAIQDILHLCETLKDKAIIVVDEAYIEFAESDSAVKYLHLYNNLVILRTLSKAYGMAGIRCGVAIANAELISIFKKVIAPYPIPTVVAEIIIAEFTAENREQYQKQIQSIKQQRQLLNDFLQCCAWVKKVWPSQTNFILAEVHDADRLMNYCQSHGIVIRNRSKEYNLTNCVRITVGSPEENSRLMEVLQHVKT